MLKGLEGRDVAGLSWYVLRVKPGTEYLVAELIEQRGHAALVPTISVWRKMNRYVQRKHLVDYPLLVRYVLVGFDGAIPWDDLRVITYVQVLLMSEPERPARLRGTAIAEFVARHGDGRMSVPDAQRFMRTHREFGLGDTVQVTEGAFEGRQVTVKQIIGQVAKVLTVLFGAPMEMTIPLALLEKSE